MNKHHNILHRLRIPAQKDRARLGGQARRSLRQDWVNGGGQTPTLRTEAEINDFFGNPNEECQSMTTFSLLGFAILL